MISVILTMRNRAHTLQRVAPSYFALDGVDEMLFVDAVVALAGFFVFSLYQELLRPGLARIALALLDRRARLGALPAR